MKLASIEKIISIAEHPNAHSLEIAKVLGYTCVIPKSEYVVGEQIVFIRPDSKLPDEQWVKPFVKGNSSMRVRAIKLRDIYSFGIITKIDIHESLKAFPLKEGDEISHLLNISKFELPSIYSGTEIIGPLPYGIPKTFSTLYQDLDIIPCHLVTLTEKIDGTSISFFYNIEDSRCGVLGREFELSQEKEEGHYMKIERKYGLFEKIKNFCEENRRSLVFRGEMFGEGIQKSSINKRSLLPVDIMFFQIYDMLSCQYLEFSESFGIFNELRLPTVPVVSKGIILDEQTINALENNKTPPYCKGSVEGFVAYDGVSNFKIINKFYDENR